MADLNFKLLKWQQKVISDKSRFKVICAGRRCGKSRLAAVTLILEGLKCPQGSGVMYVAPTQGQARVIIWQVLMDLGREVITASHVNNSEITLANGAIIYVRGADRPDTLRGVSLSYVVLDEYADMKPIVWEQVIRASLSDKQGRAMFIGTPKGNNHFKDLRDRADKGDDQWKLLEFKASQTKLLDANELSSAKNEMGEDKYNQEFECSFNAAVEGSYYGQIINDLEKNNKITTIPREELAKTYCAWDLGISDSTAIWVAQVVGKEIRLVDFYENHGQGLDTYVAWLRDNGWVNAVQLLPHDVEVRELGTGKSRKEMLQETGLEITVVKKLPVADGIQAVRRLLPRCWFDKNVKQGIDALRNYRRTYDEKRNVFFDTPLHDWCSHSSDSFRYLAVGLDESGSDWGQPLNINNKWIV